MRSERSTARLMDWPVRSASKPLRRARHAIEQRANASDMLRFSGVTRGAKRQIALTERVDERVRQKRERRLELERLRGAAPGGLDLGADRVNDPTCGVAQDGRDRMFGLERRAALLDDPELSLRAHGAAS